MRNDYETALLLASRRVFDASVSVVSKLPPLEKVQNEILWTIQTEVLWAFVGFLIKDIWRTEGGEASNRQDVEDELLPSFIDQVLDRAFDWPEGSVTLRMQQHESFLYWFDETEIGAESITDFLSPEGGLAEMAETGKIPDDSLLGKLCQRVAAATGQDGRSEFIKSLFVETAQTYATVDVPGIAASIVEARRSA